MSVSAFRQPWRPGGRRDGVEKAILQITPICQACWLCWATVDNLSTVHRLVMDVTFERSYVGYHFHTKPVVRRPVPPDTPVAQPEASS